MPGSPAAHPSDYDPSDTGERTALKRAITPALLLLFIVGDIVGGGIYSLVGEVGDEVGGAIWVPFMIALIAAMFTAGSYAELVSKYPRAGGAGLYVKKAFRSNFVAFIVAFAVMSSGVASAATLTTGFASDYLPTFVDLGVVGGAMLALALVTIVNLRGIAESVKLNVGFTLIELFGLLLIVVIAIAALADGSANPGQAFEFKEGSSTIGLALAGAALAFYALIGFEDSVNVAEETQNPRATFPGTLFKGIIIAGVVYLLVTISYSMVLPEGQIAGGGLLDVVETGPLGIPGEVFSAIGLLALINGALINMIMASRLLYGMSEEKVLPRVFGRILPNRKTPIVGILFTAAICAVLIIIGDLETLANTTTTLLLVVFAFVNASVLILRRERVDHDHFTVPSVIPVIGILISLVLLTQRDAVTFGFAGGLVALGAILWAINELYERSRGERDANPA